jgi:REP element-mobilizing transposase RayT
MGRSRYKFTDTRNPHLITCTVLHWIPVFTRPDTVDILLDSLRFLINEGLKVYAYVILENHLHLVAQSDQLDRDVARFKSYTARKVIRYLTDNKVRKILDQLAFYKKLHKGDRQYQFWQEGVHPEWIKDEEMLRQKVEYIHLNPVKRGYVDKPDHWRYSSARDYIGEEGLIEVYKNWW